MRCLRRLGTLLLLLASVVWVPAELAAQNPLFFTVVTLDHPNPQAGALFGFTLAGVGDLNGDGVGDLLVGAPRQDVGGNTFQGQAYVFSGADGSLLWTLDHPNPQAFAQFGRALAGVGDLNGDTVPDLLVAARFQDVGGNADQGQAYMISGADSSLLATLDDPNPQAFAFFGERLAGVGDLNADGVPDLLVGARGQDVGGNANQGQAFLFSGADGSLLRTLDHPNPQVFAEFGSALAGVGDLNGDAVPDLLVGARRQDVGGNGNQGQAYVFSGADGSLLRTLDHPNPQASAFFGFGLAGVGDLNADAVPDLLVAAFLQDVGGNANQGQAYVFSGADSSLLATLDDPNPQASARFGLALAGVGDLNADAVPDLLVGAPVQNVGGNSSQGQAYVFSGADGSLLRTLDHPNPQAGALFGRALAGVGDLNGDAVPDLLVGAPLQDVGGNLNQGQAFLFLTALSPQQAIQDLIAQVVALNLQQGMSNSLDAKLDAAVQAVDDLNQNNDVAAINSLQAFINAVEAQRGIQISAPDADALIAAAQQIIALLGG